MSLPSNLEQHGKLEDFPAVQLLREAADASLGGTFRFESGQIKISIYLNEGEIIFAVSNVRGHRLIHKLVQWKAADEKDLAGMVNLPESEFAAQLIEAKRFTADAMANFRVWQVTEIIANVLDWTSGEWNFNPLVRVREDLKVSVNLPKILTQAARQLPGDYIQQRFQNDESLFSLSPNNAPDFDLSPEEAYVLSRFEGMMNVETTAMICGLPFEKVSQILFSLWLGGLISRSSYQAAFNEAVIAQIRSAKIAPAPKSVNGASATANGKPVEVPKISDEAKKVEDEIPVTPALPQELSEEEQAKQVEDFLQRVDESKSYYQIIGVDNTAVASEIKQAYFKLAKQFHPDKFHSVGGLKHSRLQDAFTRLAQAYETLKNPKNRDLYDFKLSKQMLNSGGKSEVSQFTPEEIYQNGVKELQGGNYNQAVAYLTRAATLEPNVAEYQARLGQALAINPKFRHQAEEKMQLAIKLDGKNADWRILLAEYYIAVGLKKRAEGELNRLLSFHPNHPMAQQLFTQLR